MPDGERTQGEVGPLGVVGRRRGLSDADLSRLDGENQTDPQQDLTPIP